MKKSVPTRLKPDINRKQLVQNMAKYSVKESKTPVQSMLSQSKQPSPNGRYHHQFYKFRTANNLNQGLQSQEHSYNNQDASAFRSRLNESQVRENVLILRERLRNIQDHYQRLIQEEKVKDRQKSEIVMGLIDEMQMLHKQKLSSIRKKIQESAQQNQEVGEVDEKMNDIKNNIQQLIEESNNLKLKNEKLQSKIKAKIKINRQKEQDLQQINKELLQSRNEVEQFEIINLKNNKINKEITQLFKLTYD